MPGFAGRGTLKGPCSGEPFADECDVRKLIAVCAVGVLAACGGGGGGAQTAPPGPSNQAPVANAGTDQTVVENATVVLDGRQSSDDRAGLGFQWAYVSGPGQPALTGANTAQATFVAQRTNAGAPYVFRLTVTDSGGLQDTDTVQVTAIEASSAQVLSGAVTYDHVPHDPSDSSLDYDATELLPARGVTVQLLDSGDNAVATTRTDDNGFYQFDVAPNVQRRVRVRAELLRTDGPRWDVQVVDNTSGGALYVLDGNLQSTGGTNQTRNLRAPSGWTGASYGQPRAAAPFAIADSILEAMDDMAAVDPAVDFPELRVNWSTSNVTRFDDNGTSDPSDDFPNLVTGEVGTSFYQRIGGVSNIVLVGAADNDTDEYDGHIVVHEWGHFFEDRLSRSDSIGGPHGLGDRLDMRVAFGEGFGNALSGIITDDPFYRDSFGTRQSLGFAIDVESGPTGGSQGWYSEDSVQQLLYDLYDASNDPADDDTVTLGLQPLYDIFTSNSYRQTPAFTSAFAFMTPLRAAQPGAQTGIDALLDAQDIVSGAALDAFGSNETNNAGVANVLPVYTTAIVGTTTGSICSDDPFGEGNKLSNWRFARVDIPSSGSYTVTLTGSNDPDFVVFRNGNFVGQGTSGNAGQETQSFNLVAGEHVLALTEFANVDGDPNNGSEHCLTLNIQAN